VMICAILFFTVYLFLLAPNKALPSSTVNYIFYVISFPVFGISFSMYKFHLKEIAKYEYYLLGFKRTQIAAMGSTESFQSEVRKGLMNGAFPNMKDSPEKKGETITKSIIELLEDRLEKIEKRTKNEGK
jgi:hypothetical protein